MLFNRAKLFLRIVLKKKFVVKGEALLDYNKANIEIFDFKKPSL